MVRWSQKHPEDATPHIREYLESSHESQIIEAPRKELDKSDILTLPNLTWRPDLSPPGALLRADYRVVPFHSRDTELKDLYNWCHEDAPVLVRLYTGAGGMGKTRLALEVALRLQAEGWLAGFVQSKVIHAPDEVGELLVQKGGKVLAIVDYAETRQDLLGSLLRCLSATKTGPIRVILLARAALDWWESLKAEGEGVGELLMGPATRWHSLAPLARSRQERLASFHVASRAFAKYLHKKPEIEPPSLDHDFYNRILLVHSSALAAIAGVQVSGEDGILDHLLNIERQQWAHMALARDLPRSIIPGIGRAMALITLGGGVAGEEQAVSALRMLKFFAGYSNAVLIQVARLLHECYPGDRWIEPILPDLLGEHLIQREMEMGADELLDIVLAPRSKTDAE
jgi:hypothetical protein